MQAFAAREGAPPDCCLRPTAAARNPMYHSWRAPRALQRPAKVCKTEDPKGPLLRRPSARAGRFCRLLQRVRARQREETSLKLRRLRSFLEERAAVGARRLGARCGSRHATHSQHAPRCDVTRGPSALRAPQAPLRRAQGRREKEAESCLDQTRWAVAMRPGPRARLGALRARRRAEGLVCAVMKVWCVCVWSGVERRAAREKVGANNVATPPLRSL